ncbi:unnamed protein product [Closterium sp. NIES-64]|nr:unnamed protein product [Closterium sp. NIES-64]
MLLTLVSPRAPHVLRMCSPRASQTELDRRLEAALRSGDHTAALRVNEAIIRRESARRQRQAEWHMQLAASLQEQESARRKKRQRLNWGMDVLRKSEGKGNISHPPSNIPSPSPHLLPFSPASPASTPFPFPPLPPPSSPTPPPLSPRSAFPRPPGDVVSCGVDRAFTELAELDKSPGSDGRQVINVPELYTGILIVYDKVNQLVPGMHIKPPSKKQVLQLVQDYDINHDGVLDREEFGKLVRHFARTVVARVLINVLLIFSLVPLVVSIASNLAETSIGALGGSTAVTAGNVAEAGEGLFWERCWASGSALSSRRSAALRGHSTRREGGGRVARGVRVMATCKRGVEGRLRGGTARGDGGSERRNVWGLWAVEPRGNRAGMEILCAVVALRPVSIQRENGESQRQPGISGFSLPTIARTSITLPPLSTLSLPPPPPHPPPRPPRAIPRIIPGDVVSRGVDRAFTELSELDETPGSDGRQVINVPELYTGILIVYE